MTVFARDAEYALILRITQGERDAFEYIAREHMESLLRYAFVILQSRESAEDVVQDVLVWCWDHRDTLHIPGTVRAYLLTAVRHRALNVLTKANAESARSVRYEEERDRASHPLQDVEQRDLQRALIFAIRQLPQRRQEILVLRQQGLSYAEIGATLGISLKTVEAQVRLAFIRLREQLEPWFR